MATWPGSLRSRVGRDLTSIFTFPPAWPSWQGKLLLVYMMHAHFFTHTQLCEADSDFMHPEEQQPHPSGPPRKPYAPTNLPGFCKHFWKLFWNHLKACGICSKILTGEWVFVLPSGWLCSSGSD